MRLAFLGFWVVICLTACRRDMYDQPRFKTFSADPFFADGASARALPPHTVPRGGADLDAGYYRGRTDDGRLVEAFPMNVTRQVLERGRDRFDIYCAVCHGRTGGGDGMVVQRGYPAPPSYHTDRLRNAPAGYLYYVITNGYGVMYPYAARIEPADRWAIAAYIRALQLSRNGSLGDVLEQQRAKLEVQ